MFLPISKQDLEERKIQQLDFIFISGDAYVDHPSFGNAIISRLLESKGYTVGIISQPDWHSCEDFKILGIPRLGFLVSAGNIDSMVNHYTASKKIRTDDAYSSGGIAGKRPDRATIVYCNRIREAFGKKIPILIGGIEASLRRFAHYDYWSDKVRRSILIDSGADLLIFGMGEHQIIEIAGRLNNGISISDIKDINGTVYIEKNEESLLSDCMIIPDYKAVTIDKEQYAIATKLQYNEQDAINGKPLAQKDRDDRIIVQNPPSKPLSQKELDMIYSLPFERAYHPSYEKSGGIPAIREVEFSITSCRGCFGACNFCALTFHQGRTVTSRSHKSIVNEARNLTYSPNFKGYIHDVGGPTANFRNASCKKQHNSGVCRDRQCLFPYPCENLDISHEDYLRLLRQIRDIDGVKKVFVRSGIRYDYLVYDQNDEFFLELCEHHISGQLKVAPEHVSSNVLKYMGKPGREIYDKFTNKFNETNQKLGKKQFVVPYLMSSHPGSTLKDAVYLAEYLRDIKYSPEQVQDFYPTPGSISTCMYYTGIDPRDMSKVYVPYSYKEKQMQRALLQYRNPKNYELVKEALIKAHREDLIGFGVQCLIRPKNAKKGEYKRKYGNSKANAQKDGFDKNKGKIKGSDSKVKTNKYHR